MNYYDVLGLEPTCTADDIQRAYRKLAKQHHPDSGGDVNKFHQISEAYDKLKDPHQRAMFDHRNARNISINSGDVFDDMFTIFGSAGFHPSKRQYKKATRNKNLAITVCCTLEELLTQQEKTVSIKHINGSRHLVTLKIPPGVKNNTKIKYTGLGDKTHEHIAAGDLTVTIDVLEHTKFTRDDNDLCTNQTITVWDAILGSAVQIATLENKRLNLNIPAGTQHGTVLKIPGYGLPDKKGTRANMLVTVLVKIPENLTEQQLNMCIKLRDDNEKQ